MKLETAKLVTFVLSMNCREGVLAREPEDIDLLFREIMESKTLDELTVILPPGESYSLKNYITIWGPISKPEPEAPPVPVEHTCSDPATEANSMKELKEKLNVRDNNTPEQQADTESTN